MEEMYQMFPHVLTITYYLS